MASSLLALIDDIATILDDVSLMTKVAAKKTAGVLGDDLALNAQQVAGVKAEREIPVVLAVAKGSFINKLILVPAALLLSSFLPALVSPLLMLGGLYLCYEGFEKVWHKLCADAATEQVHREQLRASLLDSGNSMVAYEQEKIKGAIRTDFILSAEIIVIALGTVATASILTQTFVVSTIAVCMTFGVYGLVAGIVKLDDLGAYLIHTSSTRPLGRIRHACGRALLAGCPYLMRLLSVLGTIAMFMVGGSIVVHGLHLPPWLTQLVPHAASGMAQFALSTLEHITAGLIAGAGVLAVVASVRRVVNQHRHEA